MAGVIWFSDTEYSGDRRVIKGSRVKIFGHHNIVEGEDCIIVGDHNIINGPGAFVSGCYNIVQGRNCTVSGYANKVKPGLGSRYVSITNYSEPEAPARESTVNFNPAAWGNESPAPAVLSSLPPPVQSGTDIEDVRNLKYTSEQLPDGAAACVICFEREPDVIAMPCMHKRFCGVCVVRMNDEKTQVREKTKKMKCSLCQKDVDKFAKVY